MSQSTKSFSNNLRDLKGDVPAASVEYSETLSYKSSPCPSDVKRSPCKLDIKNTRVECEPQRLSGQNMTFVPQPVVINTDDLEVRAIYDISKSPVKSAGCASDHKGSSAGILNGNAPYLTGGSFIVAFIVSLILLAWYKPDIILKDCPKNTECPETNYLKLIGYSLLFALIFVVAMGLIYWLLSYVG